MFCVFCKLFSVWVMWVFSWCNESVFRILCVFLLLLILLSVVNVVVVWCIFFGVLVIFCCSWIVFFFMWLILLRVVNVFVRFCCISLFWVERFFCLFSELSCVCRFVFVGRLLFDDVCVNVVFWYNKIKIKVINVEKIKCCDCL